MERKKQAQSESDLAVEVLREQQLPMHYKELITQVLERMGETPTNLGTRLSRINTEINLDSRFVFVGKGMWGLASWAPKTNRQVAPVPNERNYQPKHSDYVWEEGEEEEDDERERLVPVHDEDGLDEDSPLEKDEDEEEDEDEEKEDEEEEVEDVPEHRPRRFMKQ